MCVCESADISISTAFFSLPKCDKRYIPKDGLAMPMFASKIVFWKSAFHI